VEGQGKANMRVDDAELIKARIEMIESLMELVEAAGKIENLTPEWLDAIEQATNETELLINPSLAPILARKRVIKEKIREWLALEIDPDEIRTALALRGLNEGMPTNFTGICLDEVLAEPPGGLGN
jgi:hypothetical protein